MAPEMTLTDWFAGQIMAAMLGSDPAYSNQRDANGRLCGIDGTKLANLAKNAYQAAEALAQARPAQLPKRERPLANLLPSGEGGRAAAG